MRAALEADGYEVSGADILDGVDARDIFRGDDRFDLVVHAAAHVGGRVDIDGRPLYIASINLGLDSALFEWALRTRPGRICYFSSSAAYPTALQEGTWRHTLTEDDIHLDVPERADASYGAVKLMGERFAVMAEAEGIRTHVFRPFSGYHGWLQSLDYPFPSFAARARDRRDPFQVWGSGYQVRDWIHIDDIVAGVLACLDADVPGPVNLCTGIPTSFNQLATMFCAAAGYAPKIEHVLDAPRGVNYRVGDPTKLHAVYRPKISVERGVAEAVTESRTS
jgi:nucleoside-diphosphate-sugar epimerase